MESTIRLNREHVGGYHISSEERVSNLCPIEAYDDKNGLFYSNDKMLSYAFTCTPISGLIGTEVGMASQIASMLNIDFPTNTLLSFSLFKSSDMEVFNANASHIRAMCKAMDNPLFFDFVREKARFLNEHSVKPMPLTSWQGKLHDTVLLVSVRQPIENYMPDGKEIELALQTKTYLEESLKQLQLQPRQLDGKHYIRTMQSMLNWGERASWRRSETPMWDEEVHINEQIIDIDNELTIGRDGLKIGNYYVKVLSAKKFPGYAYVGDAIGYLGDTQATHSPINDHMVVTINVSYPEVHKERASLGRKQMNINNQVKAGLSMMIPSLGRSKEDLDTIMEEIKTHRLLKISTHILVFSESEKSARNSARIIEDTWAARDWTVKQETTIPYPVFVNCLPMCADMGAVRDLWRFKTLTSKHASVLLPLFADFKGAYHHPTMQYITRTGQIMGYDLRNMGSPAPHFVVAAQTGGGKSFLVNDMIMSHLASDAQVWVIDVGRSYEKLCETVGGQFTVFEKERKLSLNPFTIVNGDDPDEDLSTIADLLHAMAVDNEQPLTNLQTAVLKTAVMTCWNQHQYATTIDHISDLLKSDQDNEVVQLGRQLNAWTSEGVYGKWFMGQNNASFKDFLNVIELEELKGQKNLQRVVLLALINTIQREVYLGERDRLKLIVIDEAWDLLSSPMVAGFIESMYRRARKYGGIIGLITQTLTELTRTATGQAIVANAPNKVLLMQSSEIVNAMAKEGGILSPYELMMLQSLRMVKGQYSELMIKSANGSGVGRFIATPRMQLLYSTDYQEVQAIKELRKQGMTVMQAIDHILEQRNGGKSESDTVEDLR